MPKQENLRRAAAHGGARRAISLLVLLLAGGCESTELPESTERRPDLGHPDSVLFWTQAQQLAGFPNYDMLFDTRSIPASENPTPLPRTRLDWSDLTYALDSVEYSIDDFIRQNHVAGLIAVHKGEVVLERYTGNNDPETKWVSYSVAKSVVSLLFGAAIRDGYIRSVDDLVTDYVPLLAGSSYEDVRIRHLLQMSSGVRWDEDYTDPDADVSREIGLSNLERLRFLSAKDQVATPGSRFNYNTGETHLAGAVLRSAIGNNLASYLRQKVWSPFGMESNANWRLVEASGPEHGGCCLSATLRDYARIGLFALADGVDDSGERALPKGWMVESTTPSDVNPGYGYLWWLHGDGTYSARGIFGQLIHIDPANQLVVAMHSAWPEPTSRARSTHRDAFIRALTAHLGQRTADD